MITAVSVNISQGMCMYFTRSTNYVNANQVNLCSCRLSSLQHATLSHPLMSDILRVV
jgi:hypothetical protein